MKTPSICRKWLTERRILRTCNCDWTYLSVELVERGAQNSVLSTRVRHGHTPGALYLRNKTVLHLLIESSPRQLTHNWLRT
jgi:hypothetical protein